MAPLDTRNRSLIRVQRVSELLLCQFPSPPDIGQPLGVHPVDVFSFRRITAIVVRDQRAIRKLLNAAIHPRNVEWEPDLGVALPKKTIKAAWELARRSKTDQLEREIAVAELLRAQGYYVISN